MTLWEIILFVLGSDLVTGVAITMITRWLVQRRPPERLRIREWTSPRISAR
jgi:hypothetical protein